MIVTSTRAGEREGNAMEIMRYYAEFENGKMLIGKQDFDMAWAKEHDQYNTLFYTHKEYGFRTIPAAKRVPGYKETGTGIIEITYKDGQWIKRRINQ